jgi:hypothetical protein
LAKQTVSEGAGGWTHQYANPLTRFVPMTSWLIIPSKFCGTANWDRKMIERHAQKSCLWRKRQAFIQGENDHGL